VAVALKHSKVNVGHIRCGPSVLYCGLLSGIEEALSQMSKGEHAMFILPASAMLLPEKHACPCTGKLLSMLSAKPDLSWNGCTYSDMCSDVVLNLCAHPCKIPEGGS